MTEGRVVKGSAKLVHDAGVISIRRFEMTLFDDRSAESSGVLASDQLTAGHRGSATLECDDGSKFTIEVRNVRPEEQTADFTVLGLN